MSLLRLCFLKTDDEIKPSVAARSKRFFSQPGLGRIGLLGMLFCLGAGAFAPAEAAVLSELVFR